MQTNKAYNFTVHMKDGSTEAFPHMTFRQFGKAAGHINVVDIENIEKEAVAMPSYSNQANLLNFIVGKRI